MLNRNMASPDAVNSPAAVYGDKRLFALSGSKWDEMLPDVPQQLWYSHHITAVKHTFAGELQ